MGMILDDKDNGIHCESRRTTVVLYTDNGDERVEMSAEQAEEAVELLREAIDRTKGRKR